MPENSVGGPCADLKRNLRSSFQAHFKRIFPKCSFRSAWPAFDRERHNWRVPDCTLRPRMRCA